MAESYATAILPETKMIYGFAMLRKIVSGGQTGVDRGALDAALARGFPCGGHCPAGRRAEDGPIPRRYPLDETKAHNYQARTRRNVEDADATLIIAPAPLSGGTLLTARLAERAGRPLLVVDPGLRADAPGFEDIAAWLRANRVATLNVAGPRESGAPGIRDDAERIVGAVIDGLTAP